MFTILLDIIRCLSDLGVLLYIQGCPSLWHRVKYIVYRLYLLLYFWEIKLFIIIIMSQTPAIWRSPEVFGIKIIVLKYINTKACSVI